MTLFEIIFKILIGPLKLVFETVFGMAYRVTGHSGIAIIFLSLIMNILVLPLYIRADAMQKKAGEIEEKLSAGVKHIKKSFSGNEKIMILQTYYRQNDYKPSDALKGLMPLLLEIPFFLGAYQFLAHEESLKEVAFGPVMDLSLPDGIIVINGFSINVLPFVMTGINLVSSYIYLKGFPFKEKLKLYGVAVIFLILLYKSPAGLVLYWILNNLFSLVKNICYKLKKQRVVKSKQETNEITNEKIGQMNRMFLMGQVVLTILTGLIIPTTFLVVSPHDYIDITYFYNPLWYIVSTLSMAVGTFLIWFRVFYLLVSPHTKEIFSKIICILSIMSIVNYMFFGTNLGVISRTMQYEGGLNFSSKERLNNIYILLLVIFIMYFVICKWHRLSMLVMLSASLVGLVLSVVNICQIKSAVDELLLEDEITDLEFEFSKSGKNVIVIVLDRAMGEYIPYIMSEKPKLKEKFSGFTYYSNVISFGGYTNFGVPAMMGGYEYTPVEMNKRDGELLGEKHDEAIKVLPVLLSQNGYDVTICDPPYAGYSGIPKLSVYDGYSDIKAYIATGRFSDKSTKQLEVETIDRNFFCFSLMKTMPLFIQPSIYTGGAYNKTMNYKEEKYSVQVVENIYESKGISSTFMSSYEVLRSLPLITKTKNSDKNTFLFLYNHITHDPMMLQTPDYKPAWIVDNREYESNYGNRRIIGNKILKMEKTDQVIYYHSNMSALIKLGEWFDCLREQGVYDNTRIIIVSDHGRANNQIEDLIQDDTEEHIDVESYYPLLMVKDFDSKAFATSDEFMTNADVPLLVTKNLIDNPINPFTNVPLTDEEKNEHPQYIILSNESSINVNNGYTFLPSKWGRVKDDIWNKENWEFYDKDIVLKDYSYPND